jgi:hypothetical protein
VAIFTLLKINDLQFKERAKIAIFRVFRQARYLLWSKKEVANFFSFTSHSRFSVNTVALKLLPIKFMPKNQKRRKL